MGIQGLLPLLKSIHKAVNLRKFEGKTIGVDAYGWLHRGTVACAMELAMGKPTRKFVDFAMHRVRMLQHFGVTPYIIFDGDYLPSKAATEADREKRRRDGKKLGMDLLNAGKTSQAYMEFQKAIDVTPEMARQLIDELRKAGVQYIVAPYEADAQMVYLERQGIIDAILSEDSDLLVFGAKCLLTKLDQYGNCIEVNKASFGACREINLTGWSDKEFRQMAILSGCDYLASINNMGLKTAYRMVRKHKTIEKVVRMLQFDGKFHVPKDYLNEFYQAELTFLHQRVFCPLAGRLVFHTQPEDDIDDVKMPYIGKDVEPEIAQGVARGDLNPMTKIAIVVPANNSTHSASPWLSSKPSWPLPGPSSASQNREVSITTFFKKQALSRQAQPSPDEIKKEKGSGLILKKRTPLGELPLNLFTHSPSQQEALRRNAGPWETTPVRPYMTSRIASQPQAFRHSSALRSIPTPDSAPMVTRYASRTHYPTSTLSEPRPPKRVRLCEDNDQDLPRPLEERRSRFFAKAVEPSPTNSKIIRRRQGGHDEINIFSDDSIEQAMLGLPDFEGFNPQSKEKITILNDIDAAQIADHHSGNVEDLTESSHVPEPLSPPAETDFNLTRSTSASTPPEQTNPTKNLPLVSSISKSDSRQSFNPSKYTLTPPASAQNSRIPRAIKNTCASASVSARSSPLQRLGASSINRTKLPMTPPLTPAYASSARKTQRSMLSKVGVPFPEVVIGSKLIRPASIPLPDADELENTALMDRGSEDLIVHDSEVETSPEPDDTWIDSGRLALAR